MKKRSLRKKVIVVFVDAGSFNVINPMLKKGKLPTFEKIMKGGTSGVLTSTIPPHTAPAWASFATGVNPGKHGVYDFWDFDGPRMTPVNSYSIRRKTLWSMINEAEGKVALINAPLTYPPRKIKGFVVTGVMTPGSLPYTYPEDFKTELLREIPGYRVYAQTSALVDENLYLEEAYNLLKTRCDATLYLMENYDWDLLVCYFYYTDQIQHAFWKYMDPTHPHHNPDAPRRLKEAVPKAYEIVDDSIDKIMKNVDKDSMIIVIPTTALDRHTSRFL